MTDFHWFTQPTASTGGTLNPVYEILDHPIVTGRAEDTVITGDFPDRPLIDGREVSDPRLLTALSVPVALDRAEALDRSAKLAGILRTLGLDPAAARLRIDTEVPAPARALSVLAALRIGMVVDDRSEGAAGGAVSGGAGKGAGDAGEGAARERAGNAAGGAGEGVVVRIHTIDSSAAAGPGRTSVRVVRSRFEGIGLTVVGQTANLDQAMRDSRVESAEVVPLDPTQPLVLTDDGALEAAAVLTWLQETVLATR